MRRVMLPGGGWLLLAALALPILAHSAKPLVKKLGKGIRDFGDKLVDSATEEPEAPAAPAQEPKAQAKKPRATRVKTAKTPVESAVKPKSRRSRPKKSLG